MTTCTLTTFVAYAAIFLFVCGQRSRWLPLLKIKIEVAKIEPAGSREWRNDRHLLALDDPRLGTLFLDFSPNCLRQEISKFSHIKYIACY